MENSNAAAYADGIKSSSMTTKFRKGKCVRKIKITIKRSAGCINYGIKIKKP